MKNFYDHTDVQLTRHFETGDIDAFKGIYNWYWLKLVGYL